MTSRLIRTPLRLLPALLAFLVGVGAFAALTNLGWLGAFGIKSETHDSQVIQAIERTQEVSLLSLSIQGISDENRCAKAFGKCVPGSTEKVFLQYAFKAKLGFDGAYVKVTKTDENAFLVSVPEFKFIGYARPTFKVATEDGGVIGWITPDIDKVSMLNKILNEKAQAAYVVSNNVLLEDQTKAYYNSLITSIAPDAVTSFEFRS